MVLPIIFYPTDQADTYSVKAVGIYREYEINKTQGKLFSREKSLTTPKIARENF